MLEYQKVLNTQRDASDPWGALANAIVEQTADDYRRNMTRLIKRGLSMSNVELVTVRSYITECKIFFESAWGDLLSHGLADVIWEKLQAEFANDLARFEARLPYVQKAPPQAGAQAESGPEAVGQKQVPQKAATQVQKEGGGHSCRYGNQKRNGGQIKWEQGI